MFFLGMSAHLFIYLLVPAFLIVCFYFRGAAGSPEVDPILPEAKILKIERDSKTYEVKLNNQLELEFNKAFQLIDIDN